MFNVFMPGAAVLEIERKYLLSALPAIPAGAERWEIEQGYLAPWSLREPLPADPRDITMGVGRLRRTRHSDGRIVCTHTIKSGIGLERREIEQTIAHDEFERHWPRTENRRLSKTRWRIPHENVVWEIDDIERGWIALAEVELQAADQLVTPPPWLAKHIVREVTDDATYTNSALAERLKSVW